MAEIIEFPTEDGFANAMLMLKEMDFEDFKSHVCFTIHMLFKDVATLQNLAFMLSIMVADLRGKPIRIENRRELAQDLGIDFEALEAEAESH